MKIAIATKNKTINSEIAENAGRSPYYLIFENGELLEVIKNPFLHGGGAGFSVAYMFAEKQVDLFIAGKIGEKMQSALNQKGVEFKEMPNKEIVEILKFDKK